MKREIIIRRQIIKSKALQKHDKHNATARHSHHHCYTYDTPQVKFGGSAKQARYKIADRKIQVKDTYHELPYVDFSWQGRVIVKRKIASQPATTNQPNSPPIG